MKAKVEKQLTEIVERALEVEAQLKALKEERDSLAEKATELAEATNFECELGKIQFAEKRAFKPDMGWFEANLSDADKITLSEIKINKTTLQRLANETAWTLDALLDHVDQGVEGYRVTFKK